MNILNSNATLKANRKTQVFGDFIQVIRQLENDLIADNKWPTSLTSSTCDLATGSKKDTLFIQAENVSVW